MSKSVLGRIKKIFNTSSTLVRGAATTFAIQVVGAGLLYAMQVLLARWLGADHYGEYTYAMAWVSLLAIPAAGGVDSAIVRFIPEYAAEREGEFLRGVMIRGYQLVLLGGGAVAAAFVGGILLFEGYMKYAPILLIAMALIPVRALMKLQTGMGRGLKNMIVAYAPQKIYRPVLVIGAIGLLVATQEKVTPEAALICTIVAGVAIVLIQGGLLWRAIPDYVRKSSSEFLTKKWIRVAFPLLLISGFVMLLGRTDIIMLGLFGNARGVGIYNVASRTATLVTFVLKSVNSIAGPTISSLYSEGKKEELQDLATSVAHYIFWPSVAIAGGLIVLSGFIFSLFGSEFLEARGALKVLVIGQVINAGSGSVGYFMNMTGRQDQSARVFGTTAVLNVVLNAIAIPSFGVMGAAIATATSMVIWNVWLNVLVIKELSIHASILGAFRSE